MPPARRRNRATNAEKASLVSKKSNGHLFVVPLAKKFPFLFHH